MKNKISPTDKELFIKILKKDTQAYKTFTERYKGLIFNIFNRRFTNIKSQLSYSITQLSEDVESAVWGKLFTKPINSLNFDDNDSIGGLVHTIAEGIVLDMFTRANNHRSDLSTDKRKKLLKEEKELTTDHEFASLEEVDLNDNGLINPARLVMNEEIKNIAESELSEIQKEILHFSNSGLSREKIALIIGLTVDQIRTHMIKINKISNNTKDQLHN